MGALISQISGGFSKAVMSTLFPVVLFLVVLDIGILPPAYRSLDIFRPLQTLDPGWAVLAFSFCAFLLTGVLFSVNTLVIRLFEGYPWKESAIGGRFKQLELSRFQKANSTLQDLKALRSSFVKGSAEQKAVEVKLRTVGQYLEQHFPDSADLILPTRFGNAVRAFEVYPRRQYGMSAIAFWPRLLAVIDAPYAAIIDDAKTSVDFLVNSSFLSAWLSFLAVLFGLRTVDFGNAAAIFTWLLKIALFAIVSYCFYSFAIRPAQDWGQHVKGAFDLYRSNLLAKLGIAAAPPTLEEERKLWQAVSAQIVYPAAGTFKIPLRVPPPAAISRNGVAVSVVRSVGAPAEAGGPIPVQLLILNATAEDAAAVVITEQPPTGTEFVTGSLAPLTVVRVERSHPLQFQVAWVPANGRITFEYQAVKTA